MIAACFSLELQVLELRLLDVQDWHVGLQVMYTGVWLGIGFQQPCRVSASLALSLSLCLSLCPHVLGYTHVYDLQYISLHKPGAVFLLSESSPRPVTWGQGDTSARGPGLCQARSSEVRESRTTTRYNLIDSSPTLGQPRALRVEALGVFSDSTCGKGAPKSWVQVHTLRLHCCT